MSDHQETAKALLLKVLADGEPMRRNEGQFLGGLVFDPHPLSEKQANWLSILCERYGEGRESA